MLVFNGDDQFGGLIRSSEILFVIRKFLHHDGNAAVVEQAESVGAASGNAVQLGRHVGGYHRREVGAIPEPLHGYLVASQCVLQG